MIWSIFQTQIKGKDNIKIWFGNGQVKMALNVLIVQVVVVYPSWTDPALAQNQPSLNKYHKDAFFSSKLLCGIGRLFCCICQTLRQVTRKRTKQKIKKTLKITLLRNFHNCQVGTNIQQVSSRNAAPPCPCTVTHLQTYCWHARQFRSDLRAILTEHAACVKN